MSIRIISAYLCSTHIPAPLQKDLVQLSCSTRHPPKDPKVLSLKSSISRQASRLAFLRRHRGWCLKNACGALEKDARKCVQRFSLYLEVPSPQPNCEIRKSSIELKFTLISVTICSLIFFICNERVFESKTLSMCVGTTCGALQRNGHS